MAFKFIPQQAIEAMTPDIEYIIKTATELEAGNQKKGLHLGSILKSKLLVDRSAQDYNSRWVISRFRPDIDQYTITPLNSKMLCSSRTYTLSQLLDIFIPLNSNNYFGGFQC